MPPPDLFGDEKDSLAFLGLLAHAYLCFDPPIPLPPPQPWAPTHFAGLNIHACVVDNKDGEILGLDRNSIHHDQSPLQHAEQRAIRAAIARVLAKRSRSHSATIEDYYVNQMFMEKGTEPSDFLRKGATCYTTLEPCPMCASTLLVARMKRVVFILEDGKYGGAWGYLKEHFYKNDQEVYGPLAINGSTTLTREAAKLNRALQKKVQTLRRKSKPPPDTHMLDECRAELQRAFELLRNVSPWDLRTTDPVDREHILRMLRELKVACNMP